MENYVEALEHCNSTPGVLEKSLERGEVINWNVGALRKKTESWRTPKRAGSLLSLRGSQGLALGKDFRTKYYNSLFRYTYLCTQ